MDRVMDFIWWAAWLSGWSFGVATCLAAVLIGRVVARRGTTSPEALKGE